MSGVLEVREQIAPLLGAAATCFIAIPARGSRSSCRSPAARRPLHGRSSWWKRAGATEPRLAPPVERYRRSFLIVLIITPTAYPFEPAMLSGPGAGSEGWRHDGFSQVAAGLRAAVPG